jgi:hypothetical protein
VRTQKFLVCGTLIEMNLNSNREKYVAKFEVFTVVIALCVRRTLLPPSSGEDGDSEVFS